jgi:hypothetical protein
MSDKRILAAAFLAFLPAAHAQPQPPFDIASVKVSQLAKTGGEGSTRESVDSGWNWRTRIRSSPVF